MTCWMEVPSAATELNGGNGVDKVTYASVTSGVQVDLGFSGPQSTGGGGIDTLLSIENLEGTQYPDTLSGNDGANQIIGLGGADTITTRDAVGGPGFLRSSEPGPNDPDNCRQRRSATASILSRLRVGGQRRASRRHDPARHNHHVGPGLGHRFGNSHVRFLFSRQPIAIGFQCRIDGSDWVACPSPTVVSNLGSGAHTFAVRAVDQAGNVDPSEATVVFTVNRPATGAAPAPSPRPRRQPGADRGQGGEDLQEAVMPPWR